MAIRRLPLHLVNQIAAGEVIERPASVVKELVENSLDAGSTHVFVHLVQAGQVLICVGDNGKGLLPDDMAIAMERHTTSKMPTDDLYTIETMGFRGEALASIGAISRLSIVSRHVTQDQGWSITLEVGKPSQPSPAAWDQGTKVTVRDLFYATPARLKFLKTVQTERQQCMDAVYALAMGRPDVAFTVTHDKKMLYQRSAETMKQRALSLFGQEFEALQVDHAHASMTLQGLMGLPTYNHASQKHQYIYVNGRFVRDRLIHMMLKKAYGDLLPKDRFPVGVFYLNVPSETLDVNVHPAKTQVRFQDPAHVRQLIIQACSAVLQLHAQRSCVQITLPSLTPFTQKESNKPSVLHAKASALNVASGHAPYQRPVQQHNYLKTPPQQYVSAQTPFIPSKQQEASVLPLQKTHNLGQAKAQIFKTYILCETEDSLIIVDQHAAHERLVYEKMKQDIKVQAVRRQELLLPEVVDLAPLNPEPLLTHQQTLEPLGLFFHIQGTHVTVTHVPSLMKNLQLPSLLKDLVAHVDLWAMQDFEEKLDHLLATLSCHNSIRAGRTLTHAEQDGLLRQMETHSLTGQCNHGRPTYVTLTKKKLETFFERS